MKIHVTSTALGKSVLKEYNKQLGIYAAPLYIVPTYKMTVEGAGDFEVIRVGLSRSPSHAPQAIRQCDVGVFQAQTIAGPTWVDYSPRTGPGTISGAVRLWNDKDFLIHEGPDDRNVAMGTYGCVEVVGAASWQKFVSTVKGPTLGGKVTVVFDVLAAPSVELAVKDAALQAKWGAALYEKAMDPGKYKPNELTAADVDGFMKGAEDSSGVNLQELRDLYLIGLNYEMPDPTLQKLGSFLKMHSKALGY